MASAMMTAFLLAAALSVPGEAELEEKIPEIFSKSAAHYKALDAAATPLMKDAKGGLWVPHGFKRATGKLDMNPIYGWTAGHYPGSLWYLYEATGDAFFKDRALVWTETLAPNAKVDTNHDIGFIMYCSYGNARRILKTDKYDALLRETAESLTRRFNPKLGLIRSWGDRDDAKNFLVIPDNLMNLELLEWAGNAGAKGEGIDFSAVARSHADATMHNHFRDDGGVYHVLDYDQRPGFLGTVQNVRRGQGLSCRTAWSRGQSWAIYGYTMMYRMSGLVRYLDFAQKLADYAINHPNMPADGIPYWDYGAPGEERDSSAGSIMASALLELSQYVDAAARVRYRGFAVKQLLSLASPAYFSEGDEIGHFLLKHGVGHKPINGEVDTPLNYGDYYFLEALLRFRAIRDGEKSRADVQARLPAEPHLPGADREGWRALAERPDATKIIAAAEKVLSEPIPDTSDALYHEFRKTGNRSHYQKPYFQRMVQLVTLTVAEAIERKGRFVPRLVESIDAICAMKSWVLPAHDGKDADNFFGRQYHVDLFSSEVASHLAHTVNVLCESLPPDAVRKIRERSERLVFAPLRRSYVRMDKNSHFAAGGEIDRHWWMCGGNNWNAVCHDNVVEAAFGLLDDPRDRALVVANALGGIAHYARGGFEEDGYCTEGMGYWNYGLGHLLMMGLTLRDLTDGQIDIFTEPKFRKAAEYAYGYQLERGVSPAFADGNGAPGLANLALVRRVWPDLTCEAAENLSPFGAPSVGVAGSYVDLHVALLGFGKALPATGAKDPALPLRTEFPCGQVWLLRAGEGLSVAIKGGHNCEHHNHNDIGSYYLVSHGRLLSGDPGAECYTARTFSSRRYESKVLSSYGHPVPVIGGQLQPEGRRYHAKVVRTDFTDARDTVALDLTRAYDVKALKSLVRTFVFDRAAKTFTVTDKVAFSEPTSFEEAYTTFEGEKFGRVAVAVTVRKGGKTTSSVEHIDNPERISPDRHAVRFVRPVTEAEVEFVFRAE